MMSGIMCYEIGKHKGHPVFLTAQMERKLTEFVMRKNTKHFLPLPFSPGGIVFTIRDKKPPRLISGGGGATFSTNFTNLASDALHKILDISKEDETLA